MFSCVLYQRNCIRYIVCPQEKTRVLTLQAMTELLRQPHFDSAINSLSEYAHDIIEKVLQMHVDSNLTVTVLELLSVK